MIIFFFKEGNRTFKTGIISLNSRSELNNGKRASAGECP